MQQRADANVRRLATGSHLASLDQLRGQIVGLIAAPGHAPGHHHHRARAPGLARVVNAYATKDADAQAEAA
jgi:hypothetical protein